VERGSVVFHWLAKGVGFGTATFTKSNGAWFCDTETLGEEFVQQLLVLWLKSCTLDVAGEVANTIDAMREEAE